MVDLDLSALLLHVVLVGVDRLADNSGWLFLDSIARDQVYQELLVGDRSVAPIARFGPGLALLQMHRVGLYWHVQVAVLAILRFLSAVLLVGDKLRAG